MNKQYKLEHIFKMIDGDRGKNYPKSNEMMDNGYCLFLNASNVTKNGWCFNNNVYISQEKDDILNKGKVERGDLIITTRGTVGNVALYDDEVPYEHVRINSGMLILKIIDKKLLNSKYAYYMLGNPYLKKLILAFSSGSAQPQLPIKDFKNIKVSIPDLCVQNKIVDKLNLYDCEISKNIKRIKILEQIAENLYKEWFVRFRFPGYKYVKFENNLPNGWSMVRLSEVYNTFSGGTPSRKNPAYYENGSVPWIKTGELQDNALIEAEEYITQEGLNKSSAKLIPENSVLMAMYGVNIGKLCFTTIKAACNQACCVFEDRFGFSTKNYLFHYLKSIRGYLLSIGFGAAQQNLSQDLIKNLKILWPAESILRDFENFAEPIYTNIKYLEKINFNLKKQRDLLLSRLMSGKMEVK